MAFRDENTTIIRMKRDFDSFIQDNNQSRCIPSFNLDNGDTASLDVHDRSSDDGIPVHALLEREKQYKRKETEYIEAKHQILMLQSKISSMETSNKRARIEIEQQLETVNIEKRHDNERVQDLLAQLKCLQDKESGYQDKLSAYQQEMAAERTKYDQQILSLQKEKIQLSDDLQQEKENCWEKISELKGELMRQETELKICQTDMEELRCKLKQQMKRSSDNSNLMKECEEYKMKASQAEQKIKDLELQISRLEEDSFVGKAMKTQLATFHEMEKENRKLKDDNSYLRETQENNLLLKEQHASMQKKLDRLENRLAKYNSLVAENEDLKSRLDKWETVDRSGSKLKSPTDLSRRVAELQHTEAIMLSQQGELKTNLTIKDNTVRSLQDQVNVLQQQFSHEKTKYSQQTDLAKRLQRKLLLVTKERDGYKRIIDSYESEVTVSLGPDSTGTLSRLQQLEESVEGYRKQTDSLESELNKVTTELTQARHTNRQLESRISELQQAGPGARGSSSTGTSEADKQLVLTLRERLSALEKALETCEKEKHVLECRIEQRHLQGDYDPTKQKVLHFKFNPVDMASEERKVEINKLREENERLRQRIKLLEENDGRIEDLTVAVEQKLKEPGSSKDIEEIRSQLNLAELKNKRLIEAFKKTSQEVREVCYQLTGYKIDFPSPNHYRVSSMYAESPTDYLQFQQSEGGEIQMLGTNFSSSVKDLMETYLIQRDSIPAFLSSITLDLFSRQTMAIG